MAVTPAAVLIADENGIWKLLADGTYPGGSTTPPDPDPGDPYSWTLLGLKPTSATTPVTGQSLAGLSGGWHARKNTDVAWVHSDRGSYLYALDLNPAHNVSGKLAFLKAHQLSGVEIGGSQWEDSCYDPVSDKAWVANCGSNNSTANSFKAFRFPELVSLSGPSTVATVAAQTFWFRYPNNGTYNCESMACDPITGRVVFVIKETQAQVFLGPATLAQRTAGGTQMNTLTQITSGSTIQQQFPTGCDFTPDGQFLYVRNNNRQISVGKYQTVRATPSGPPTGFTWVENHALHPLVDPSGAYKTNECLMVHRDYPTQPYFYIAAEGTDTEIGRIHT